MDTRRWRGRYANPRGTWGEEIKRQFLAVLRETGNASEAGRRVGHMQMFRKRRRRDPGFAAEWEAALAAADARLSKARGPFPDAEAAAAGPLPHPSGGAPPATGEDPGGMLRPGRKARGSRPQPVIRRSATGRTQLRLAGEGHWTEEIEADFLERLRATGNFSACARAVGFQPASLFQRARKWPAFRSACDEALEEASVRLDYALVAHAHNLLGTSEADGGPASPAPDPSREGDGRCFDPEGAMRIIGFLDRRKGGRTTRGPRKGPPERSFAEAVRSVLDKIDAIERHEQWAKGRAGQSGERG